MRSEERVSAGAGEGERTEGEVGKGSSAVRRAFASASGTSEKSQKDGRTLLIDIQYLFLSFPFLHHLTRRNRLSHSHSRIGTFPSTPQTTLPNSPTYAFAHS